MSTFVSPFTGNVIQPTDVSYYALTFSADTDLYWPTVVNPTQVPAARIMDCVASSAGLTIYLPDATQGAVGSDILFRNQGTHSFVVKDFSGAETITVDVGISKYVYLTSNVSTGGSWSNVTFGAGSSTADAVSLQGAGLTTISGKLATTQNIIDITSTPLLNDASRAITYNWGAGNGNLNLPVPATLSRGWYIGFRNSGTGALNINPISPALINGIATVIANPGDSGFIAYDYDTGNFITIGLTAPSNVTFTSATYDVDNIPGSSLNLVSFAPIIQTYIAQTGSRTTTLTVTLPAITQLYVLINNTNQTGYNIDFVVSGSSQPPLILAASQVILALSDGVNLFPLTTSTTGFFYGVNGSAGLPTFAFNNDTHTGMYLVGNNVLGFSANGIQMARMDNTNTSAPLMTVDAQLNAQLIAGGTF